MHGIFEVEDKPKLEWELRNEMTEKALLNLNVSYKDAYTLYFEILCIFMAVIFGLSVIRMIIFKCFGLGFSTRNLYQRIENEEAPEHDPRRPFAVQHQLAYAALASAGTGVGIPPGALVVVDHELHPKYDNGRVSTPPADRHLATESLDEEGTISRPVAVKHPSYGDVKDKLTIFEPTPPMEAYYNADEAAAMAAAARTHTTVPASPCIDVPTLRNGGSGRKITRSRHSLASPSPRIKASPNDELRTEGNLSPSTFDDGSVKDDFPPQNFVLFHKV